MKTTLQKIINENYHFEIGSCTTGKIKSDIDFVKEQVEEAIFHYLFDIETFQNGGLTSEQKTNMILEFKSNEVKPRIDSLENTLENNFVVENLYNHNQNKKVLKWRKENNTKPSAQTYKS